MNPNLISTGLRCLLLLFLPAYAARAETVGPDAPNPRKLTTVIFPTGEGTYAEIAKRLSPATVSGFSLSPLDAASPILDAASPIPEEDADGGVSEDTDTALPPSESVAEQAREAALAFDLVTAAELWRREADRLLRSEAAAFTPRQTAFVLLEAGAASAAAGETDIALSYFRKATALAADIEPGPEISPDAKALFRQATALGPALLEPPRRSVLDAICAASGSDGVIWLAVGTDNGEQTVLFRTYLPGESEGEMETRRYNAPISDETFTVERSRFERLAAGPRAAPVPPPGEAGQAESVEQTTDETKKPWYKRWWFYTVVGGLLIAGGATGVSVWAATRPETTDVILNY